MYKDEFLNYLKHERNFSPNTIKSYCNDLDQFFSFMKRNSRVINYTSSKDIRNWIILNKETGLESSTINRKISCLRTYFRFLKREGFMSKNPTNNINLLSVKKRLKFVVYLQELI